MELTAGGIISKTFGMIQRQIGPLIATWLVYFAIQIALMLVLFMVLGASVGTISSLENPAAMGGAMIIGVIVFYACYILIYCGQAASLIALGSPLLHLNFGTAFATGMRRAIPLLGVIVLMLIAYVIAAIPVGLIIGALAFAGKAGSVLGALLGLGILIFVASRLSIVFPAIVVEGVGNPITAITRSWALTRGKVLPIFLAMLIFIVIAIALLALVIMPAAGSFMALAGGGGGAAPAVGGILFAFVGLIVVSVFIAIFAAVMPAVIHAQLSGSAGENLSETFA